MADIGSITSISLPKREIVHLFRSAVNLFVGISQCKASSLIAESEPIFKKTSHCKGLSAAKTMVLNLQVSASNNKTMLFVFTDFCLEKDKKY